MFVSIRSVYLVVVTFLFLVHPDVSGADRYKRPMHIHQVKRLGLEIWTEYEPEWKAEVMLNGYKPIFVAHSPSHVYPPSGMLWVNHSEVNISDNEFPDVARSTLETVAKNFKLSKEKIKNLDVVPVSYGVLTGFEANFVGIMGGEEVDVKVFTGRERQVSRGPITIQAYTIKGKMPHLVEQIRRSWSHTRYLD